MFPRIFTIKSEKMVSNQNGLLVPVNQDSTGVWMEPEQARLYFAKGKGIKLKTLMDYYVYGGRLKNRVRNDVFGWWILISQNAIERRNRIINKQAA
jgi:hypothetical protein